MRTEATTTTTTPAPMALKTTSPFLIGIGGSGMSALARLLQADPAARPAGSDSTSTDITAELQASGIPVHTDADASSLPEATDLVITSAAIRPDHPQLLEAQRRGIPTLTYAEALGRCMVGRTGVSIAGTHGKSTTTAMLGVILTDAGLDPSVIVGATCPQLAQGALATSPTSSLRLSVSPSPRPTASRLGSPAIPTGPLAGKPGLLLAEACEFNRSFHHHRPTIASIANVEADHLDIYGSLDAVIEAFAGFAQLIPSEAEGGHLLIAHDGAHRREITAGLTCRVDTIGYNPAADWRITHDPATRLTTVTGPDHLHTAFTLSMPGEHNASNAALAAALAMALGADPETVGKSLSAFQGLDRRMSFRGERPVRGGAVRVYDDYGHHPTEIDATLRALRHHEHPERQGGRLVVVFQPHQHSRTRFLLEEFATSFEQADIVIVPQIYFVRDSEAEKQRVSAADLVERLRDRGVRAMHLHPFGAIVESLEEVCRANDTLVVMGAGPVWTVARDYLRARS